MVANPASDPKPYHFLALRKAIAAADQDLAANRTGTGWRFATDVRGWKVADELVVLGLFERNIHGQTHWDDLNKQRYRITAAGRAAYTITPDEAVILTRLQTALDKQMFEGWCYWQELANDWQICDQLCVKGWTVLKPTPGKQDRNRAYRIEPEGSRVLAIFNQKEASMSAPTIPLEDGRQVDPATGEILEPDLPSATDRYTEQLTILTGDQYIDPITGETLMVTDAPLDELTTDELTTRAATATNPVFDADPYAGRMATVDPQTVIVNLQTDLQKALRDKYEAERQRDEAQKQLKTATALPNPGEVHTMRTTLEDQRLEINRLKLRLNDAESNGWKGKYDKLAKDYKQLDGEAQGLRQPDLLTGAKIAALVEERDNLQQQVDLLKSPLVHPVIDDDDEPGIQNDFFVGVISHSDLAGHISQKEKEGWEFVYEIIHQDGRYNARIRRDTRPQSNIDTAIEEALQTPRRVEGDAVIGLDDGERTGQSDQLETVVTNHNPDQIKAAADAELARIFTDGLNRRLASIPASRPLFTSVKV